MNTNHRLITRPANDVNLFIVILEIFFSRAARQGIERVADCDAACSAAVRVTDSPRRPGGPEASVLATPVRPAHRAHGRSRELVRLVPSPEHLLAGEELHRRRGGYGFGAGWRRRRSWLG